MKYFYFSYFIKRHWKTLISCKPVWKLQIISVEKFAVKEYPHNVSVVELSPQGTDLGTLNHNASVPIQALRSTHT